MDYQPNHNNNSSSSSNNSHNEEPVQWMTVDTIFNYDARTRRAHQAFASPAAAAAAAGDEKDARLTKFEPQNGANGEVALDLSANTGSTGGRLFACDKCGKHLSTQANLVRHMHTHRSPDSQLVRRCPTCDKAYVSSAALSMHLLTHNPIHKCHICGKCFSRAFSLKEHIRCHLGLRPLGCSHCGRTFANRSNLRSHMKRHIERAFRCKFCFKRFHLESQLVSHFERGSCAELKKVVDGADEAQALRKLSEEKADETEVWHLMEMKLEEQDHQLPGKVAFDNVTDGHLNRTNQGVSGHVDFQLNPGHFFANNLEATDAPIQFTIGLPSKHHLQQPSAANPQADVEHKMVASKPSANYENSIQRFTCYSFSDLSDLED